MTTPDLLERMAEALPYEEAEKLALRAIHGDDGRGMVGAGRNHLHQRVARALMAASKVKAEQAPQLTRQLADALRAMIASAADNKCGLRIADEALAAYDARGAQGDELVKFLCGEGPLDGVWFGESHPTERGDYWWRKYVRARLPKEAE